MNSDIMDTEDLIQKINQIDFDKIDLKQAESAQLMNRVDSKFIISTKNLLEILSQTKDNYSAVEINNQVVHNYFTEYFDTPNLDMYLAHQNGRYKRYKIRIRKYNVTGDSFYEIKLKTPDGKTRKKRVAMDPIIGINPQIIEFVSTKSPYKYDELKKMIITDFNRLTLVSKNYKERVTIDIGLAIFTPDNKKVILDYLSIIEIKQDKSKRDSAIAKSLKELGIRPSGFSKYSIGQAVLKENIKRNSFKKILLKINKIQNG